jgi:ClpX C4-type zinc finger
MRRLRLADVARLLRLPTRLRCSFCGRSSDEVGRLVAGPSVYICDECIKTCVAVLEQHGGFPPSPPADQDRLTHA